MNNVTIAFALFGTVGYLSTFLRSRSGSTGMRKEIQDHINSIRQEVGGRPKAAVCRKVGSQIKPNKQSKTVHFVRHAEGIHNVAAAGIGCLCNRGSGECPYMHPSLIDPKLTERGRGQVAALQVRATQLQPEVVIVSPHVRTIESALIIFEKCDTKFLALECAREQYGKHICDKRSLASDTARKFGRINMSLILEEDMLWTTVRESRSSVIDRAFQLVEWLKERPESNIAVVTHSSFLLTLFNAALDTTEQPELSKWFDTAEMRSVVLEFDD
jgi:broad specificity phosphatase PhoE